MDRLALSQGGRWVWSIALAIGVGVLVACGSSTPTAPPTPGVDATATAAAAAAAFPTGPAVTVPVGYEAPSDRVDSTGAYVPANGKPTLVWVDAIW